MYKLNTNSLLLRDLKVCVLGVNPFEDVPGYHYLSLLHNSECVLFAVDDSEVAVELLTSFGCNVEHIPHPCADTERYLEKLGDYLNEVRPDIVIPGTDGHLEVLSRYSDRLQVPDCSFLGVEPVKRLGLNNKVRIQEFVGEYCATPKRSGFCEVETLSRSNYNGEYPIMLKGVRKGAVKCEEDMYVSPAFQHLMKNPLNTGENGGVYFEEYVTGEEHAIILLLDSTGRVAASVGMRKLATSKEGTTLAGILEKPNLSAVIDPRMFESFGGPIALEIEYRQDIASGSIHVFEVNLRLPTWISALGQTGSELLTSQIRCELACSTTCSINKSICPEPGSYIYRLPASGIMDIKNAFSNVDDSFSISLSRVDRVGVQGFRSIYPGVSPHQFLVK